MAERFAISELLPTVSIPRNTLFAASQNVGLDTADTHRLSAYQVFDYILTDIKPLSANWNSVYTTVRSFSADWSSVYTTVRAFSADWSSVYTTVRTFSADWSSSYTTVNVNSADWVSNRTTVNVNSAEWSGVASTVRTNSGDWRAFLYLDIQNNTAGTIYAPGVPYPYVLNTNIRALTGFLMIPPDVTYLKVLTTGGGGAGGLGGSNSTGGGGGAGGTAITELTVSAGEAFFYYCGYAGDRVISPTYSGRDGEWSYFSKITNVDELSTYVGFNEIPPASAVTVIALASGGIGGIGTGTDIGFGVYVGKGGSGGVASIGDFLYNGASGNNARIGDSLTVGDHGGNGGSSYWGRGGYGSLASSTLLLGSSALFHGAGGGGQGRNASTSTQGAGKGGRVMVWLS